MNIRRIDAHRDSIDAVLAEIRGRLSPAGDIISEAGRRRTREVFGEPLRPSQVVQRVCDEVRLRGLEAVLHYSQKLDGAELSGQTLRVSQEELARCHAEADPRFLATLRRIRDNILKFQQALLPTDLRMPTPGGGSLGQRWLPVDRVGICVPGGAAAYPSTVLMTAVPAQAAGVGQLAVVAPPTRFGSYNADLLATCRELGITEVYRVGGAQAVAALAYGVEGLPKVDKIVGPGNLFVALAKKLVYGEVDIDSVAGPSEVVIIGDDSTRPDYAAADLIAQAEHSPGASILVTWSRQLWEETATELKRQLAGLERGALARESLEEFGALILVGDADEACRVADAIAPEHLHIATGNGEALLAKIRHAGAVFLGPYSPVAVGDYFAGPSHVLPTGGTARFFSPLSALDFLRGTSVIEFTRDDLAVAREHIGRMADAEQLSAHRASVEIRFADEGG